MKAKSILRFIDKNQNLILSGCTVEIIATIAVKGSIKVITIVDNAAIFFMQVKYNENMAMS